MFYLIYSLESTYFENACVIFVGESVHHIRIFSQLFLLPGGLGQASHCILQPLHNVRQQQYVVLYYVCFIQSFYHDKKHAFQAVK